MIDFENGHRFEVMTSTALIGKARKGFNWAAYYATFEKSLMTPRELAVHIWRGYAFTPVWATARREENFVSAGHIAFDFDAGDTTSGLDYLMRDGTFAWMFASFGYSTPSSTPENPRSRLVFVLEYPIDNAQEYRNVYQAVAWYMALDGSHTDPACKDPLRLYYGSKDCTVKTNWSVLGQGAIDTVKAEYDAAHPKVEKKATLSVIDSTPGDGLKEWKRRRIVEAVRNAPAGERHTTLLKRAREAGGYVASGVFTENEMLAELTAAAGDFGEGNDGRREVERVIRDGLRIGQKSPLYFQTAATVGGILP